MAEVSETTLPGVGVRHDFTTTAGDRVGILAHRTGRRDLLVYDRRDPDACVLSLVLEPDDSHTLAELLGGGQVSESINRLQQIEGLAIDWLEVQPTAACVGRSLREAALRGETGVLIVAVVRDAETMPTPGPDFVLQEGDIAVAVGTPEGIRRLFELLQRG